MLTHYAFASTKYNTYLILSQYNVRGSVAAYFTDAKALFIFPDKQSAFILSVRSSKRYSLPISLAPLIIRQLSVSSQGSYLFFSLPFLYETIITIFTDFVNYKILLHGMNNNTLGAALSFFANLSTNPPFLKQYCKPGIFYQLIHISLL